MTRKFDISVLKSDALLLLAAAIWGFAFVAQRAGMEHVGPFVFNGIRFALGSLSLLPLIFINRRNRHPLREASRPHLLWGTFLAGGLLFLASSLQQVGIVYTTAGKAGFITGLYVILVPMLGLFWRQRVLLGTWTGAVLALVGLYFLTVHETFTVSVGDWLVLAGAFFWAAHVHALAWLSPRMDSFKLSAAQYAICSALSLLSAAILESFVWQDIGAAALPILYGGIFSVGIAFTLQVVAQRKAHPAHVVILLSLEGVFAVLGGWLLLSESLTAQAIVGCFFIFVGMIVSQITVVWRFSASGRPETA